MLGMNVPKQLPPHLTKEHLEILDQLHIPKLQPPSEIKATYSRRLAPGVTPPGRILNAVNNLVPTQPNTSITRPKLSHLRSGARGWIERVPHAVTRFIQRNWYWLRIVMIVLIVILVLFVITVIIL